MAGSGADIFDQSIEHCIAVRLEVPELRGATPPRS